MCVCVSCVDIPEDTHSVLYGDLVVFMESVDIKAIFNYSVATDFNNCEKWSKLHPVLMQCWTFDSFDFK